MKFRYKVLLMNLMLISVSLGLVGCLMIRKNFEFAKQTQLKNAVVQNNLVQSSIEYELLQVINRGDERVEEQLAQIGENVSHSMRTTDSSFYIRYDGQIFYASDGGSLEMDDTLYDNLKTEEKNYRISREGEDYYIYVTSLSQVQAKSLNIISKYKITQIYSMIRKQVQYFRIVLILVLVCDVGILHFLTGVLTRPLEQLNHVSEKIASGDYQTRVQVCTQDEIGLLAKKFNVMAQAVEGRVEELNDMIQKRDQFVADFTHEIKTPMTTIIGYADMMRSMELPAEEQMMALNYIFSEGKRLENLSTKLFELIYLKQNAIEKHPVHIADLCREAEKTVADAFQRKHVKLKIETEPAIVQGSRELLVTALVNLLDNARKASDEGKMIELYGKITYGKLSENTCSYQLCVIDHGIGMTQEQAARICDEFYMADKSRARKEGGAGIGMSLVALILEHHGARLVVDSEPGKGSHISILFSEAKRLSEENEETLQ